MSNRKPHFLVLSTVLFTLLLAVSCRQDEAPPSEQPQAQSDPSAQVTGGGMTAVSLTPNSCQGDKLLNVLTSDRTGITFQNILTEVNLKRYAFNGAGVATGDYDGDGLIDIYLVSEEGPSKLYHNTGNFTFEDVTEQAGLANNTDPGGFSIGAHFADIDNDNDLDLFLANWKVTNRLFQNNGDGTFTDITEAAGVTYVGGPTTSTFADYDRDGDIDFFVATYRPNDFGFEFGAPELDISDGQASIPEEYRDWLDFVQTEDGYMIRQLGEKDLLYQNNGDGTFTEVAQAAGVQENNYWGLSAIFTDIDNDLWPDLYVTNDFWSPDTFYHNNGDGTFSLVDPDLIQNTPMYAMGIDFADINNDGLNDYFIGDMLSREHNLRMTQHGMMEMVPPPPDTAAQTMRNTLHLNNGDGSFSDIAWLADVAASEWTWTAKFSDVDLDGFVDLLITNGMVEDVMDSDVFANEQAAMAAGDDSFVVAFPPLVNPNIAFRNNGDLTFTDVSTEWGFDTAAIGHGAGFADMDGDGDLDILVNNINENATFYCNNSENPRIAVRLQGQQSNRFGLGALITLVTDDGIQTRQMSTSGGYLSSHDPIVVFGLGDNTNIQALHVKWPSGHEQSFDSDEVAANQQLTITEPDGASTITPPQTLAATNPLFQEVGISAGLSQLHQESNFDDFAQQSLLPRQLSTLGPGLAWHDVDSDGYDDLYIAGADGQTGAFYRNNGDGTFANVTSQTASWLPAAEEMAPLWWYDGLNETPALIISFSTIERTGSPSAQMLTVENEFQLTGMAQLDAEDISSTVVTTADYDQDGDLDVFLGGRVLPGQWPLPTSSRLYRNDNGSLTNATFDAIPQLEGLGMVTSAIWSDIDNDGDSDLVIATEYGPLHLFINNNGRFAQVTQESGLGDWTGLWTGLVAADFNEDGFMDLAATNLGLNTRYNASPEQPAVVYAGNIDGDGDVDIVEAYYIGDTLYPIRERGMAGAEMPFILSKYETFKAYSDQTLEQIYEDRLRPEDRYEATTLAHTLFLNQGNGNFTATPLPQLAQITAGYGLVAADLDNDGHEDLYLVGNFSYADHDNMGYVGGISYWLRGHGDGTFTVVPSPESGLYVPYDGRGLAVSDFNRDGWVDIGVAINNGRPLLFQNQGNNGNNCAVRVQLRGDIGNPTGVGARLILTRADGSQTMRDVQAGGGYLSQDSAVHLFGLGTDETATLAVRWPDGTVSPTNEVPACTNVVVEK